MSFLDIESNKQWTWSGEQLRQYGINYYFPDRTKKTMNYIEILQAIIFPGVLFTIGMGFLFDWLDRKTAARMQGRIGPKIAGPSGILQPLADFLKLLFKEEVIPSHADKTIFLFAPALYFLAPILSMLFIPIISPNSLAWVRFRPPSHPVLLAFAAFVVAVLSYSSASSFTTIATGRLVLQYVSYEIPLVLAIITAALYSRSLSVEGIVASQSRLWNIFVHALRLCGLHHRPDGRA